MQLILIKKQMKRKAQPLRSHQAFMLIDAVMGISICASAFALAFGFLYTLTPSTQITTYETYKQLFLNPLHTHTAITPLSQPTLTYEVLEQSYINPNTLEILRLYTPKTIR